MPNEFVPAFTVYCSTGCTCCSGENHDRGPFSNREVVNTKIAAYRAMPLLASQFSATGHYEVSETTAEKLPDGRIIVDGRVFASFKDAEPAGSDEERIP
jgi:hypothetical protein